MKNPIYEMDTLQSMHNILRAESEAIAAIPITKSYEDAIDIIVEHVHRRGGKLVTSGMGKAGQIAVNIATTFASTGTPAVSIHPCDAQHGDLGVLQPTTCCFLFPIPDEPTRSSSSWTLPGICIRSFRS